MDLFADASSKSDRLRHRKITAIRTETSRINTNAPPTTPPIIASRLLGDDIPTGIEDESAPIEDVVEFDENAKSDRVD